MVHTSFTTKRIIGWGLSVLVFIPLLFAGLALGFHEVQAADNEASAVAELAAGSAEGSCLTAGATPAVCPATGVKNALEVVGEKIVGPRFRVALIQMLLNLSQFVLDRLAYEAAVMIASGGPGETSLFYEQTPSDAFAQLGLEVAGEAVGALTQLNARELGIEFDLCDPGNALQLALAIGIKQQYQPTAPKCDILEVIDNWDSFTSNIAQTLTDPEARQEAILQKFAESLKPGRNELSASLRLNIAINQKVYEARTTQFLERVSGDYKDVRSYLTGVIHTPSDILQKNFEKALEDADGEASRVDVGELMSAGDMIGGLALTTAATFTNTLLSTTISRIYAGLFDTELPPDPFDVEALGTGDRESAEERFSSIISPSPIVNEDFNILSEFVVCPVGGGINRGLYNCVLDASFMAAVSRGTGAGSGAALTVQEAIDEGLINGEWPLIPPSDEASNQDPFCYTYGYCYGNLVKMRNARILPVGWELAALRNTGTTRATLQEIIDGFDDCTEDGAIGPASASNDESRWCHLIDPNWVLKYPETQCRSLVNGEIRVSQLVPGRNTVCVDSPSCIGEDNDGNCTDGYGYCVQEENVWRFRGDECPEEFATCLAVTNAETGDQDAYLVNTVEYSVCDQNNAGCLWYRTNKYFDDGGTADDTSDDTYEWIPDGETYTTADYDDDWVYEVSGASSSRETYSYTSESGETYEYELYAHEDRAYFTHDVEECDEDAIGCTQLYKFADDLHLNAVINPSFEEDENGDGLPDGWQEVFPTASSYYSLDTSTSVSGSNSLATTPALLLQLQQVLPARENNFYTFSFYAKATTSGDQAGAVLILADENGDALDASGTSSLGDCEWDSSFGWYAMVVEPGTDDFDRFDCTFTTIEDTVTVRAFVGSLASQATDTIYLDAIQFEVGEDANSYVEGYSKSQEVVYYQVAPDYLGCSGSANDPAGCNSYAQVCSAQEVGCNLYAPEDGDPSVPAIISELDECPSECVGYTTYKQEATTYESEDFPLYFIADAASSCSEAYVGCDAYTNLGEVAEGGEDVEYFTDLRFCLSEDLTDEDESDKTPATFFTWEGSDNEGYQLVTWSLLESNYAGSKDTFDSGTYTETDPDLAPCTTVSMTAENEVTCDDTLANMNDKVWSNTACDEYADIFENPDCREFYDSEGNAHYREFSDTISIDNACTPYRKDSGNQADCEDSGGFWTEQGFCRYYVLAEESTECPAEQNGCRSYTGGAGRNATTVLNDTFETGTYDNYAAYNDFGTATLAISNESVASDGQSLYVLASSDIAGFQTEHVYLDSSDLDATYDIEDSATCTGTEVDGGCEVTDSSTSETCTVADGEESCGAMTNLLVEGKTFVLDFWAKGSGDLYVSFVEEGNSSAGTQVGYDLVDDVEMDFSRLLSARVFGSSGTVALDGSWQLYSLGPFDTSDLDDFDENAILVFATDAGEEFYIDNITLKQVEDNVTIIKDSWVVPSTCDATPDGTESDQYYLGCEAYTDQNGEDANLYQFTQLCSEEVVGCEGFYHTGNSESAYQQVFNARCIYSTDEDYSDSEIIDASTACEIDGVEYCTIAAGEAYCNFDVEQVFSDPLPEDGSGSTYFAIVYGPETRVVEGDTPVYIVADAEFTCDSPDMGCQEFGQPSFNQDQTEVESFESVYLIDLPADYDNILCDHEALFCEEWETTQDGNLYFKDPLDKTCEYKTTVTLNNQTYSGWFKEGTTDPCYWEDVDEDGEFDVLADEAYLISGSEFGVWRNGDTDYDQWIGSCDNKYDLCTEFIDTVDTEAGREGDGTSYYFTNDELLSEDQLTDSQRCNGTISQKFGCALFNNTTDSELFYNSAASYVVSKHADVFFGGDPNELVDPVSCTNPDNGEFSISEANAEIYNVVDNDTGAYVTEVNLCKRRCSYNLTFGDELLTAGAVKYYNATNRWFERSCLTDVDCPVLGTADGEEVSGTCLFVDSDLAGIATEEAAAEYYLEDDANEIIKVNRDRECSAWLACRTSQPTWNEQTGRYENICQDIDLCVNASATATGTSTCTEFTPRDPLILSDRTYSERNVNWDGIEYSGMSIPYQLPVEHYDQFLVTPSKGCYTDAYAQNEEENENGYQKACSTAADCGENTSTTCVTDSDCSSGECSIDGQCHYWCNAFDDTDDEYRLVYNAGTCDASEDTGVGRGGECNIGYCESDGDACGSSSDCGTGDTCIVGYCQVYGNADCSETDDDGECQCTSDADCSGTSFSSNATETCDTRMNKCVNFTLDDEENRVGCSSALASCTSQGVPGASCVPSSDIYTGACFNDRCLTDIRDLDFDAYNNPDPLDVTGAAQMECRGYPEVDSPHGEEVVFEWKTYNSDSDPSFSPNESTSDLELWSTPYTYVGGYNDANVCSVDSLGNITNCDCTYDRVEYGGGSFKRYVEYGADHGSSQVPKAVCVGGDLSGVSCNSDTDCQEGNSPGTCESVTRQDTLYGWYGYCIEYDTSIQINASNADEDRACLSWIPVDQLEGATNLYAKFEEAGFELENNYFCADVQETYWVGTTGVACAEWQDADCPEKWDDFFDEIEDVGHDYECLGAVACPDGFMAIMTGCREHSYPVDHDPSKEAACGKSHSPDSDSDCPFFCVPDPGFNADGETVYAYHDLDGDGIITEGDYNDDGELDKCQGPRNEGYDVRRTYTNKGGYAYAYSYDFTTYVVNPEDFRGMHTHYSDCITSGLTRGQVEDIYEPYDGPENATMAANHVFGYPFFYGETEFKSGFSYNNTVSASCDSIVEVSNTRDNKAFTNRLWEASSSEYTITGYSDFQYTIDTEPDWFGLTITLDELELYEVPQPIVPYMCEENYGDSSNYGLKGQKISDDGASCDSGSPTDLVQAQTFRDVYLGLDPDDELSSTGYVKICDFAEDESACASTGYCSFSSTPTYDSLCNAQITCDLDTFTCDQGPLDGQSCLSDIDCRIIECFENAGGGLRTDHCGLPLGVYEAYKNDTVADATNKMEQLFGLSYGLQEYAGWGADDSDWYDDDTADFDVTEWYWDITDGSGDYEPEPPTVVSLGECLGSSCLEGSEGRITVNNVDTGDLSGLGSLSATASFFMYADKEQMPIRTLIMDWGDGVEFTSSDDWPTDAQYGSTTGDNYYKNHRGMKSVGSRTEDICNGDSDTGGVSGYGFGESDDGCSNSYVSFNHDFLCTESFLASLTAESRECIVNEETGNIENSPCYGGVPGSSSDQCVFQPRVFVEDNWGWCASNVGICDTGGDYSEEYCYGGTNATRDECDYSNCPGDGCDKSSPAFEAHPWVYYDGFIILDAE